MDALSYSDAISRAERLGKMVVILWSRQDDPRTASLRSSVLDDAAVRTLDREARRRGGGGRGSP